MNRPGKLKTGKKDEPDEMKVRNVIVKIYRSITRGRPLYTLAYRDTSNRRVKKSFADLREAKSEACAGAAKIQTGQIDVLQLSSAKTESRNNRRTGHRESVGGS